uniref:TOG domain-containing protein n=1 Tax=Steinernema glaseri TaxID=37863 RepID=A0A1I7ZCA2_9BILA
MSVSFQDPTLSNHYGAIRQFLEQLRKFINSSENQNGNVSGGALSDASVVLLRLKDQLVLCEERNGGLPEDLFHKQFNGLLVLIKVVVILQGMVSSTASKPKFSQLLMRKNSSSTLKRKASVAEADCMECIKLILQKSSYSWHTIFENSSNLEVILYSINSPQLDSKCYALEILLNLLDHPQGYEVLLRSLSVVAARQGEYLRMPLIITQLRHGLHTAKLHIQILVVRLLNKLMLKAPSTNHRVLVQCEISLARFSPEYVEKLLSSCKTPLGGTNSLREELDQWRKLVLPLDYDNNNPYRHTETAQSPYGFAASPQNFGSYRSRNRGTYKNQQAQSTVIKNVEKQRMKRQNEQAEMQRSMYASERNLAIPDSPEPDRAYQARRNQFDMGGRMRRVKSESAMITEEAEADYDSYSSQQAGLGRFPSTQPRNPPAELNSKLSRSTHDLSRFDYNTKEDAPANDRFRRKTTNRAESPVLYRSLGRKGNYSLSPRPAHHESESRQPRGGFSYIFPNAPIVSDIDPRRSKGPEARPDFLRVPPDYPSSPQRPPSSTNFTRAGEDRPLASPGSVSRSRTPLASPRSSGGGPDRNVVYIPINMEERREGSSHRYDKRRQTDGGDDQRVRSSNGNAHLSGFGEDVRDALSQFDYLNDYDAASVRSGNLRNNHNAEIYHF